MSEAHTPPATGFGTEPAPPGTAGATLYPDGGGNRGAASEPVAPAGDAKGGTGSDTQAGPAGADTNTGADTSSSTVQGGTGSDTVAGSDTGTDTTSGQDTSTGSDTQSGADSLTADSYKDKIALPDTFVADDALLGEAATLFAEVGIPPDKAQKLVDFYAKAVTDINAKATNEFNTQQTAWTNEINAMPEFQGEARAKSLQAIGKVFDEYGTPEARAALDTFGTGNNPALVKMFLRMANALSEGTPTTQGRPAPTGKDGKPVSQQGKTVGERLYPNLANGQQG